MWWVNVNAFWKQMEELRRYKVVYLDDYDPSNKECVVITFDGVYENVYKYAFPILKKYGYPFELFIIGKSIGKENDFDQPIEPPAKFANMEQLKIMVSEGGRLQWHSKTHKDLSSIIDPVNLEEELKIPEHIKKIDPNGFNWFAYPHGKQSLLLSERVKKSFRGAVSCNEGNSNDRYQLNRITVTNETCFSKSTVSLIIPNYNYGCFAAEAIESALRQTVAPDEIIFIDDCSTDNSIEVAERYENIKIIRNKKNLGIVKNFNKAVSLTKCDYICFLGADNRLRSDYVEKCKFALDTHKDAAIAYTSVVLFGPRAEVEALRVNAIPVLPNKDVFLWEFPEFNDESKSMLHVSNFIHGSSMYRRSAYDEVGGYIETNGPEDHNLFLRMVKKGWTAVLVPEFLLEYRQHSNDQRNIQINYAMELAYACRQIKLYKKRLDQSNKILNKIKHAMPAIKRVLERLKTEEVSSHLLVNAGELCFELGLFSNAKDFFEKALFLDPKNSNALNNLGVLSIHHEDYVSAIDFFRKTIELDPNHEEAKMNLKILFKER